MSLIGMLKKNNHRSLLALLAGFFLAVSFAVFILKPVFRGDASRTSEQFIVRVRVKHDVGSVRVLSESGFMVRADGAAGETTVAQPSDFFLITGDADGIFLGKRLFKSNRLTLVPEKDKAIDLNGSSYTGNLVIVKRNGRLDVFNYVEIEDYLKGVVPREMYTWWPMEALKAQAVAARSYVLKRALARRNAEYDVTADTRTQVYGGRSAWNWRTSAAVEETRGQVLYLGEEFLGGYYHSCCGGHTQDMERVWGFRSGGLRGVKCRWCRWSPRFRWRRRIYTSRIRDLLIEAGYEIERVDNIVAEARDSSGRLENIKVRDSGRWFEIKMSTFRAILGRSVIKSSNFRIKKYPRFYLFSGYGWGHGVGMCQWGAFFMGLRRWDSKRILEYYYSGAEIVQFREIIDIEERRAR